MSGLTVWRAGRLVELALCVCGVWVVPRTRHSCSAVGGPVDDDAPEQCTPAHPAAHRAIPPTSVATPARPSASPLRTRRPATARPSWCPWCRVRGRALFSVVHIPARDLTTWQCLDCHNVIGVDSLPKR